MEQPYIYTSAKEETEVESAEFDDWGVVPEVVEGCHSIFAAMVQSAGDRGDSALEVLGRQIRFIAGLYHPLGGDLRPNPSLRTLDLRFISQPEGGGVSIALLGKAFDSSPDVSRQLALEFWEECRSTFPSDYELKVVTAEAEFEERFLGGFIEGITADRQVVDVRRYEEFIPMEREEQVWEQDYLVYPFVWSVQGLAELPRILLSLPQHCVVSVSLRQTKLYEAEERHLCDLYATFEKLEKVNWLKAKVQGKVGMRLYSEYLRRLRFPFLMKVQIAGEGAVPNSLIHALGVGLTGLPDGVLEGSADDYVETSYDFVFPETVEELATAQRNLKLLEHTFWGWDLPLAKYRRLRYLVDARWANCAFRFLPPPRPSPACRGESPPPQPSPARRGGEEDHV
jgi:hypothetical protein